MEIPIASPAARARVAGLPAAMRPTTANLPGTSVERTANPSIAELGNGGRSTAATAACAVTRPAASSSGTVLRVERRTPGEDRGLRFGDGE